MGCNPEKITGFLGFTNSFSDSLGGKEREEGEQPGLDTSGEPEAQSLNPEVFDPDSVEVRCGDPMVDAPRLFELFTEETTVEHLEGVVPKPYNETVIDIDPVTREEKEVETGNVIPATTVEDIREEYRRNPNFILLTAEDPSSGLIIGTCTVDSRRSPSVGEIGKLAVDRNYREKGIANKLLRTACAFIFTRQLPTGDRGLDCEFSEAFVILNVNSSDTAQNVFANMYIEDFEEEIGKGFLRGAEREGTSRSWNNRLEKVVRRNSQPMGITRRRYIDNFPNDHINSFPKQRPPKVE